MPGVVAGSQVYAWLAAACVVVCDSTKKEADYMRCNTRRKNEARDGMKQHERTKVTERLGVTVVVTHSCEQVASIPAPAGTQDLGHQQNLLVG